ncbi:MAG: DUF3305 domain-containing protein [Arenicellales bacterium]|nr:DUF3305 domain-containing protein [Arenicellales bacterium]
MTDKPSAERLAVYTDTLFPVSVIMERREKRRGQWSYTEWKATGILVGNQLKKRYPEKCLLHEDKECRRFLWTNFVIELFKDGAESYWNNLMASKPSLFVVCRDDEETEDLEPFLVTANYDEIIGYLEVEDKVFSLPIPPEIYQWLERYVVNNYIPPERRKRKRTNWEDVRDEQTSPSARRH